MPDYVITGPLVLPSDGRMAVLVFVCAPFWAPVWWLTGEEPVDIGRETDQ